MPKSATAQAILFGEALGRLRNRTRLTQKAAAKLIGGQQATWSRWEKGDGAILNVVTQQRAVEALGFTMEDYSREIEAAAAGKPMFDTASGPIGMQADEAQTNYTFPLVGYAKAGSPGVVIYNDEAPQTLNLANYIDHDTQFFTVSGESMEPLLEQGDIISVNINGVPRKNRLCVVVKNDGSYFVKKFVRMTATHFECLEMEALDVNGRQVFAERPISFPTKDVRAVYPARIHIN